MGRKASRESFLTDFVAARDNLPSLSIIVATRNRADNLARLLESLAVAIRYVEPSKVEVIVADNGSTDRTGEVVSCFQESSAFKVTVVREESPGKARALNQALKVVRGRICAFVDDDIIVAQTWVKEILSAFATESEMGIAGGRVEPHDPAAATDTLRTGNQDFRVSWKKFTPQNIPIIGCNVAFRRSLLNSIGGFDPDVGPGSYIGSGDDLDLIYRALVAGAIIDYRPEIKVSHRHGRVSDEEVAKLRKRYLRGRGAFYHKYASNGHRRVRRWAYWEVRSLFLSLITSPWRAGAKSESLAGLIALGSGALASVKVRGVRADLKEPVI